MTPLPYIKFTLIKLRGTYFAAKADLKARKAMHGFTRWYKTKESLGCVGLAVPVPV